MAESKEVLDQLVKEEQELKEKIKKLDTALTDDPHISKSQVSLMFVQESIMKSYWNVLSERIYDLKQHM